jgi:hypothetical protein
MDYSKLNGKRIKPIPFNRSDATMRFQGDWNVHVNEKKTKIGLNFTVDDA